MDPEYARKKALMDWIVDGMAGRHYPKPSLPADYRPNEIFHYSPALKKTGGYSYAPPAAKENPMAKPQEPRKYQPNFLLPFVIPTESQEPQQIEPQQDSETKQTDRLPNVSNWATLPDGRICNKKTGKCVWANGIPAPPLK